MRIILIVLLIILIASSIYAQQQLIYLNIPERIKTYGVLDNIKIKANVKYRFFFHYYNFSEQKYNLIFSSNILLKDYRIIYFTDKVPTVAGKEVILQYFKTKSNPGVILLKFNMPFLKRNTISGIIEGTTTQDGNLKILINKGDSLILKSKTLYSTKLYEDILLELKDKKRSIKIGTKYKDKVDGAYGTLFNVIVSNKNKYNIWVTVYLSSRGGTLDFVCIDNQNNIFNIYLPKLQYKKFISFKLNSNNTKTFVYIPTGGYSYPLEFILSPEKSD